MYKSKKPEKKKYSPFDGIRKMNAEHEAKRKRRSKEESDLLAFYLQEPTRKSKHYV